ncbi:uncharacterized protein PITG_04347 [Phytophthora infestans T30-4]|uniref:Uncharacterized protein n=1 Tax=Phytophthora infestans (strain T30-4) TaxID=403677 RepID=D0N125_PHYIT|nr:uncharacterized protein PITG_04347 [Phytophthora infestans T30-4]EEY67338.1 conserved hypothetical protein [Phytophthora infestans T30-4]|eukprot:XP_002905986.1 conserved hypothetical protein [Phytophthora infestans T30-4]
MPNAEKHAQLHLPQLQQFIYYFSYSWYCRCRCASYYCYSGATTTVLAGGLALPASAVTLTITPDIDGTPTAGTGITPSQSFSRLLVPTYSPNPSADHALAQKKTFRYLERTTNKFTAAPGAWTVSNGIANPKRLIMQPFNPFRSPFSTVPATTSHFAALKNLQITVGNVPIWNNPVSFGYDFFARDRQWESLYRFVAVDIGRRLPSEDDASKIIIVSFVASVDTAMGTVSQGPVQN